MAELAKTLIALAMACTLCSSCAEQGAIKDATPNEITQWDIQQNAAGSFVYCTINNCPERTLKTLQKAEALDTLKIKPIKAQLVTQIYFAFASSQLNQGSIRQLNNLIRRLTPDTQINLRGFTDPISGRNSKVNQHLALARMNRVKNWLIKHKIKNSNISAIAKPPCCNSLGLANSPEAIRKKMRVVIIKIN